MKIHHLAIALLLLLGSSRDVYGRTITPLSPLSSSASTAGLVRNRNHNKNHNAFIPKPTTHNHNLKNKRATAAAAVNKSNSRNNNNKKKKISGTGRATIANEVFNLVKAIVGVGVLSLPAGIADSFPGMSATQAVGPALVIMTSIGLLSAFGFATIGKVCAYTNASSYRQAWSRSVGEKTAWIPAYSTTVKTFLACLAFSMVLKDTFSSLLQQYPISDRPSFVLIGVTLVLLLPLCLKKSLTSLAPFSLLGVLGMVYTFIAMTVRYFDGSYALSNNGPLLQDVPKHWQPSFAATTISTAATSINSMNNNNVWASAVTSPTSLILVCMLSTAYMAHFNAPKFYLELYDNTLPRYHTVVYSSFSIAIALMAGMTAFGFLTFGHSASSIILNNYSPRDMLIYASRLAVTLSLVFSYPLAFQGCRDGVLDLLNIDLKDRSESLLNGTTIMLLSIITILAVLLNNVSLVLSVGGATFGNALTYVYPAIMYYHVNAKQQRHEYTGVALSLFTAVLGIAMGGFGAKMALEQQQQQ